jgi:hypothetical protein
MECSLSKYDKDESEFVYSVKGCDLKDCFHYKVCSKDFNEVKDEVLYCKYYVTDGTILVNLGEKYLGRKNI